MPLLPSHGEAPTQRYSYAISQSSFKHKSISVPLISAVDYNLCIIVLKHSYAHIRLVYPTIHVNPIIIKSSKKKKKNETKITWRFCRTYPAAGSSGQTDLRMISGHRNSTPGGIWEKFGRGCIGIFSKKKKKPSINYTYVVHTPARQDAKNKLYIQTHNVYYIHNHIQQIKNRKRHAHNTRDTYIYMYRKAWGV